eukprot:18063-Heterococcus_DN1.PRE.3
MLELSPSLHRRKAAVAPVGIQVGVDAHTAPLPQQQHTQVEAGSGTYAEMCAVATDIGHPELVYAFLALASSSHAAWSTRRGSSLKFDVHTVGTAAVDVDTTAALAPHVGRLVPRLYRHRFDASGKTRGAMEQLWKAVIAAAAATTITTATTAGTEQTVIRQYFQPILSDLLRAATDRSTEALANCPSTQLSMRSSVQLSMMTMTLVRSRRVYRALQCVDTFCHFTENESMCIIDTLYNRWRDRHSACLALAELLSGRTFADIGTALPGLWTAATRAMDDVKESVCEAAADFAKTLANVSVRLCDATAPSLTATSEQPTAAAAAATSASTTSTAAASATSNADTADGVDGNGGQAGLLRDLQRFGTSMGVSLDELSSMTAAQAVQAAAAGSSSSARARNAAKVAAVSPQALEESAAAVGELVPWLLDVGIMSKCTPVQALSLQTLQRVVSVAHSDALRPHLATLIASLVEGLSALEPQALQYMQFHAEKQYGVSGDQMERLRLSAARGGPLQEALDRCCRHLDEVAAAELMPRLLGLLRIGVGLATRSAAACVTPNEIRTSARRLLPTLTNAALSERSGAVRGAYASALAGVSRLAPQALIAPLALKLCELFKAADPDLDSNRRAAAASLLKDLALRAGAAMGGVGSNVSAAITTRLTLNTSTLMFDNNIQHSPNSIYRQWSCPVVGATSIKYVSIAAVASPHKFYDLQYSVALLLTLPLAFVARHDPDTATAEAFTAIWDEGLSQLQTSSATPTPVRNTRDVCRILLPAITAQCVAVLSGVSRGGRASGAAAASALASALGSELATSEHGTVLLRAVMDAIPGRAWESKDALLEAVAAVAAACKGQGVSLSLAGVDDYASASDAADSKATASVATAATAGSTMADAVAMDVDTVEGATDTANTTAIDADAGTQERDAKRSREEDTTSSQQQLPADGYQYQEAVGELQEPAVSMDILASTNTSGSSSSTAVAETVTLGQLLGLLLRQLQRSDRTLRRAAARSLTTLLNAFDSCDTFDVVAPALLPLAGLPLLSTAATAAGTTQQQQQSSTSDEQAQNFVLEARAVECLAAAWPRSTAAGDVTQTRQRYASQFAIALATALPQRVWSVRVPLLRALKAVLDSEQAGASTTAAAAAATQVSSSALAVIVSAVVSTAGTGDLKYAVVRAAAMDVVLSLSSVDSLKLALMSHKETLEAAARAGSSDKDASVATAATAALQKLAWW